jgi:hypothetical protein
MLALSATANQVGPTRCRLNRRSMNPSGVITRARRQRRAKNSRAAIITGTTAQAIVMAQPY